MAGLTRAVDLDSRHGIALGLLGIAAARAGDEALLNDTVDKVCHAPDKLHDVLRVGSWFGDVYRLGERFAVKESANWAAFNRFATGILENVARDERATFDFAYTAYHLRLLGLARSALSIYVARRPDDPEALAMLIDTQLSLCDLKSYDDFVGELRRRIERDVADQTDSKIDPYNLLTLGVDYATYAQVCALRSARIMADQGITAADAAARPPAAARARGRIRVGFLLPYSWFSSLNMVLEPLLPCFDRTRFEIHAYTMQSAPQPDAFEARFRQAFDSCTDVPRHDPAAAAERIRTDGIDILLETSGHTRTNCLSIAAHRPAPVQAHYLGYSNAIAAPFIDYLIADGALLPSELQAVCSDRFALMPKTVATFPKAAISHEPASRAKLRLPDDVFCYCSFNHLAKIEPRIFAAWLDILRRVPASVLVLCHWNLAELVEKIFAMRRVPVGWILSACASSRRCPTIPICGVSNSWIWRLTHSIWAAASPHSTRSGRDCRCLPSARTA